MKGQAKYIGTGASVLLPLPVCLLFSLHSTKAPTYIFHTVISFKHFRGRPIHDEGVLQLKSQDVGHVHSPRRWLAKIFSRGITSEKMQAMGRISLQLQNRSTACPLHRNNPTAKQESRPMRLWHYLGHEGSIKDWVLERESEVNSCACNLKHLSPSKTKHSIRKTLFYYAILASGLSFLGSFASFHLLVLCIERFLRFFRKKIMGGAIAN